MGNTFYTLFPIRKLLWEQQDHNSDSSQKQQGMDCLFSLFHSPVGSRECAETDPCLLCPSLLVTCYALLPTKSIAFLAPVLWIRSYFPSNWPNFQDRCSEKERKEVKWKILLRGHPFPLLARQWSSLTSYCSIFFHLFRLILLDLSVKLDLFDHSLFLGSSFSLGF